MNLEPVKVRTATSLGSFVSSETRRCPQTRIGLRWPESREPRGSTQGNHKCNYLAMEPMGGMFIAEHTGVTEKQQAKPRTSCALGPFSRVTYVPFTPVCQDPQEHFSVSREEGYRPTVETLDSTTKLPRTSASSGRASSPSYRISACSDTFPPFLSIFAYEREIKTVLLIREVSI